jgi:hypothetical protein
MVLALNLEFKDGAQIPDSAGSGALVQVTVGKKAGIFNCGN